MDQRTCAVDGCERPFYGRGWCKLHYDRWKRTGEADLRRWPTVEERFWARVDLSGGPDACWPWTGPLFRDGRGEIFVNPRRLLAHRFSYELANGPIPDGLSVCHRCDNPPCVNPAHLFLGTALDNAMDRTAKGRTSRWRAEQTHCVNGHPFDEANTYRYIVKRTGRWGRMCKQCQRDIRDRAKAPDAAEVR